MAWHAIFKEIIAKILKDKQLEVRTEQEVGKLPLKIDIVIRKKEQSQEEKRKEEGEEYLKEFRNALKKWNIIELKTLNETFTVEKLFKLIGYFGLFGAQERLKLEEAKETGVWLLTAQKPVKLFNNLKSSGWQVEHYTFKGSYKVDFYIPIIFVVFNELPIDEDFYPFLLFSTGKQLKRFLNDILNKDNNVFINWSYFLYRDELITMAKAKNKPLDRMSLNIRSAVLDLGLDNFIEAVGVEELINAVGLERAIDIMGLDKVIDAVGVEKVIDAVGVEKVIDAVGVEKVINAVGVEKVISHIPFNILKEYVEKVERQKQAK